MNEQNASTMNPVSSPRKGLKAKLIFTMMVVGTLPLLLAIIISYLQGNKSLQEVIGASFQALAFETATRTDLFLLDEFSRNSRLASHPTIILAAKAHSEATKRNGSIPPESRLSGEAQLWKEKSPEMKSLINNGGSRVLKSFLKGDTPSVESTRALYITNDQGVLISSINYYPDYLNADKPSWQKTIKGGAGYSWFGEMRLDPKLDEYVFDIAVPIISHDNQVYGVFHRVFNPKVMFSSSIEPFTFGETGHVMMITSEGRVIDCPILPTGFQLADPDLVQSVTGPDASWARTQGDGHGSKKLSIIGYSPLLKTNQMAYGTTEKGWFTFAWQSSDELFAPTQKLFLWISTAGIFSIFLIGLMGSLGSNKIVHPIRQLQNATARIGRGEEVEPLDIRTGDEIELLANEINTMNTLLKKSFSGLEDKVREKTKEVLYLKEYTDGILMSVPDVILIFKEDLKIEYANKAFEDLTGLHEKDVLDKSLAEGEWEDRDQWNFLAGELDTFSKGIPRETTLKLRQKEAKDYKPRDPLAPPTASNSPDSQTILTLGSRSFYPQFFYVAIESREKRRIGILLKEITEEKALQAQLARAEKLSGLGTLAAGIAHEMNNPLYSIMGFTEAILDEGDPSRVKKFAQKILDRSKHMASIILNVSGYSRATETDEVQEVNLNDRLDASLDIAILDSYTDDIRIEKNYNPLPPIMARPEETQQIFLNIFRNAVQAMEGKGKLTISSQLANGNIQIRIQDNGPGIPQDYLSKVFDPFFTTKEQGKGTGLGLNIVHNLVVKYEGHIDVESELGEGTVFTVSFPIKTSAEAGMN